MHCRTFREDGSLVAARRKRSTACGVCGQVGCKGTGGWEHCPHGDGKPKPRSRQTNFFASFEVFFPSFEVFFFFLFLFFLFLFFFFFSEISICLKLVHKHGPKASDGS